MMSSLLENIPLVLVSSSPRRRELLTKAGFDIKVKSFPFVEAFPEGLPVDEVPVFLAEDKARQLPIEMKEGSIVITADTIVVLENEILGKPQDRDEAVYMLESLSGKEHKVLTGVCISMSTRIKSFVSTTNVTFSELSSGEIDYYIDNFEPYDKAGSYGIQEWIGYIGVEKITGSYFNVMGLPIQKLYIELKKFLNKT